MKKMIFPTLIAVLISASAFKVVQSPISWKLNEQAYSVKMTSSKFDGVFTGLQCDIQFDEANLVQSKITASIDAASVNTGNGMRNKHAKQGLDAENFPRISFQSTSIQKSGNGYEASGKLTIKNVTKEIKLPFTFSKTSDGGSFEGKFSVVPAEYDVTKSGTPDLIELQLLVPVKK